MIKLIPLLFFISILNTCLAQSDTTFSPIYTFYGEEKCTWGEEKIYFSNGKLKSKSSKLINEKGEEFDSAIVELEEQCGDHVKMIFTNTYRGDIGKQLRLQHYIVNGDTTVKNGKGIALFKLDTIGTDQIEVYEYIFSRGLILEINRLYFNFNSVKLQRSSYRESISIFPPITTNNFHDAIGKEILFFEKSEQNNSEMLYSDKFPYKVINFEDSIPKTTYYLFPLGLEDLQYKWDQQKEKNTEYWGYVLYDGIFRYSECAICQYYKHEDLLKWGLVDE